MSSASPSREPSRRRRHHDRPERRHDHGHGRSGDDPEAPIWAWEGHGRPGNQAQRDLMRGQIAMAAVDIADADGFEAVSMRRIARHLGVGTMTLYTYVRSKDDLIDLMLDAWMGEVVFAPGELPEGWRAGLRAIAHRVRAAFERHPWIAGDFPWRPTVGPNHVLHIEQSLRVVAPLGLEAPRGWHVLAAVDDYAFGHAIREITDRRMEAAHPGGQEEAERLLRRQVSEGDFPLLEETLAGPLSHEEVSDRFEVGLDWLLDGIEAAVTGRAAAPPGPPDGAG